MFEKNKNSYSGKEMRRGKNGSHKTREVLVKMLEIYETEDVDWMGFKLSKDNPYTYHHIIERRNGGPVTIENGAILTRKGHDFLNFLDLRCHQAYEDYQAIFRRINKNHGKLTDEMWEDIYGMMLDLFFYKTYKCSRKYDLSEFEEYTYAKKLER